jgi:hypothetical protein
VIHEGSLQDIADVGLSIDEHVWIHRVAGLPSLQSGESMGEGVLMLPGGGAGALFEVDAEVPIRGGGGTAVLLNSDTEKGGGNVSGRGFNH